MELLNKEGVIEILEGEYLDALAFFSGIVAKYPEKEWRTIIHDIDDIVFPWVVSEDAYNVWMDIFYALLAGC